MKSSASLIEDMLSEHGHAIIEAAEGGRRGEAIVSQAEVVGVEVSAPVLLMEATGKLVISLNPAMSFSRRVRNTRF